MNTKEILVKVKELEDKKSYEIRCVNQMICPDCGGTLKTEDWGHGYDIVCPNCKVESICPEVKFLGFKISNSHKIMVSKSWDTIC